MNSNLKENFYNFSTPIIYLILVGHNEINLRTLIGVFILRLGKVKRPFLAYYISLLAVPFKSHSIFSQKN